MITARVIDRAHRADLNLPNEPFPLWGRMVPSYQNGQWSYEIRTAAEVSEMCFPEEAYDFDAMESNTVFLGAYDGEHCVGLAVLQQAMFRYLYLLDLKVSRAYRRQGVGRLLMDRAMEVAQDQGYRGLYTQGQDNNLSACLFYVNSGFRIGGLDTEVYTGTSQQGKADILFYRDLPGTEPK